MSRLSSTELSDPVAYWLEAGYAQTAQVLRSLRNDANLTQRDLAGRLGKPQSTIHSCENNTRRVDLVEFIAWAAACDEDPTRALHMVLAVLRPSNSPHAGQPPHDGGPVHRSH